METTLYFMINDKVSETLKVVFSVWRFYPHVWRAYKWRIFLHDTPCES